MNAGGSVLSDGGKEEVGLFSIKNIVRTNALVVRERRSLFPHQVKGEKRKKWERGRENKTILLKIA